MAEIVDLQSRRDGPPDPAHVARVVKDGKLETWFEFACSYTDGDGREFGFRIWALDAADAQRRLEALVGTAKVDGQIYSTVRL